MAEGFLRVLGEEEVPDHLRGNVVAIGNFDGVHRGHQAVMECALKEARRRGVPALVLTFDPHPRKVFRPDVPLFVLTSPHVKARLIEALDFDAVVERSFTREFSSLSEEDFVTAILQDQLGISHAVTGLDFHFGKNRQGGPAFLMESGERYGFGVTLVNAVRDEGTEIISSSRIRQLLSEGKPAEAAGLLGYRYTVEAEVVGGEQLGRTLGFPTANMQLSPEVALKEGIYAVRFRRADGTLYDGVANLGRRPTVGDNLAPLLETFVFDFSGDLYGEIASVSFFSCLRSEIKFNGLDPLVAQMKLDEAEARTLLSGTHHLSELERALTF